MRSDLTYLQDVRLGGTITRAFYPFVLRYGTTFSQCSPLVVTHVLDAWVRESVNVGLSYSRLKRIAGLVGDLPTRGGSLLSSAVSIGEGWAVQRAAGGGELRLVCNSRAVGYHIHDECEISNGGYSSNMRHTVIAAADGHRVVVTHSPGVRVEPGCHSPGEGSASDKDRHQSRGNSATGRSYLVDLQVPATQSQLSLKGSVLELEIRPADLLSDWFLPAWRERPLRVKDFLRGQGVALARRGRTLVVAPTATAAASAATAESDPRNTLAVLVSPDNVKLAKVQNSGVVHDDAAGGRVGSLRVLFVVYED